MHADLAIFFKRNCVICDEKVTPFRGPVKTSVTISANQLCLLPPNEMKENERSAYLD